MSNLQKNKDTQPLQIKEIYSFLRSQWCHILKAGGILYILLEALPYLHTIEALSSYKQEMSPSMAYGLDIFVTFCIFIVNILIPAVVGVLILSCLLEKRSWPKSFFSFSFGRVEGKYSLWLLLLMFCGGIWTGVVVFVTAFVADFFTQPTAAIIISISIGMAIVAFIWIIIRCSLFLPALVDGAAQRLYRSTKASFFAMKGYLLRYVWAAISIVLPFMIIGIGIEGAPSFIIFFIPESLGIPLLIFTVVLGGILKLFSAAGLLYISFRFYTLRKEVFLERLARAKK